MNPSTALATVLVDELVRCGLTDAVLAPGSRSAPLALALAARPDVRLHVRLDERSAAFTALGLGKATGRPAAVLTTSGTAVVNLHPAVVEADLARVPLLVLTADRPPELRGTAANQTIDQLHVFGRSVRWFWEVGVPHDQPGAVAAWRAGACRAWAAAAGAVGSAGPVHANVAFRDPLVPDPPVGFGQPLDGRAGDVPWLRAAVRPRPPAEEDVAALAARVTAARRGVLVVGDTAADPAPLVGLAEAAGWPLLAEAHAGARQGPHAVSVFDLLLRHEPFAAAHRPDLAVVVGRLGVSRPLLRWLDHDVPQVLVDPDGAWLDPARAVAELVVADPALLAGAVASLVPPRPERAWLETWLDAERRVRTAVDAALDAQLRPSEPRLARDLAASLPDGTDLVVASSMPVRDLTTFAAPRAGLRVLANRGASGIDGFVSTAVGVALAAHRPAAALAGDLSVLHDAGGLILSGQPVPDLVLVVVHNDGGGIFSFLPQAAHAEHFERVFGTPHGVDLSALAAATGVAHERLDAAADLPGVVAAAMAAGGVHLVEVRTHRGENLRLHRELEAVAAAALGEGG